MNENGLSNVMEIVKRQKWENLFKRRELVHIDAVKEFYAKITVTHLKKKDVVKSKVRGVDLEFDHEKLATILGVPGKNGICEYIKEVWEESKYTKPLEITRIFANDDTIMKARRVKSVEMKPSQRFIHFLVMKNVIPRFGKRDTTSFMDLSYMDHLTARRLVNLPRVMMRHMSYVISICPTSVGDLPGKLVENLPDKVRELRGANRRWKEICPVVLVVDGLLCPAR
ncbi:hypothetical protein Dimus_033828 [Dionaea muscipula]